MSTQERDIVRKLFRAAKQQPDNKLRLALLGIAKLIASLRQQRTNARRQVQNQWQTINELRRQANRLRQERDAWHAEVLRRVDNYRRMHESRDKWKRRAVTKHEQAMRLLRASL